MKLTAEAAEALNTGEKIGNSGATPAQLGRWEKMAKAPTKAELNASGELNLANSHDTIGINDTTAYRAGLLGRRTVYGTTTTYQQQSQNREVAAKDVHSISVGQNDVVHVDATELTNNKDLTISIKDKGIVALKGEGITVDTESSGKIKVYFSEGKSLTLPADVNQDRVLVKTSDGNFQTLRQALTALSPSDTVAISEEIPTPSADPVTTEVPTTATPPQTVPNGELPPPIENSQTRQNTPDMPTTSASVNTTSTQSKTSSTRTTAPQEPSTAPSALPTTPEPTSTPAVIPAVATRARTPGSTGAAIVTPRNDANLPGFTLIRDAGAGRGADPSKTLQHPNSMARVEVRGAMVPTTSLFGASLPTLEYRKAGESDPFLVVSRANGQSGQILQWRGEFSATGEFLEPHQALPLKGFRTDNNGLWSKSLGQQSRETVVYDQVKYRFVQHDGTGKTWLSSPTGHRSDRAMKWVQDGRYLGHWEFEN